MGSGKPKNETEKQEKEKPKEATKPKVEKQKTEVRVLVRLANTDLDVEKPLIRALRGIKGISYTLSNSICLVSNLDPKRKLSTLSETELGNLEQIIADPVKFGIPAYLINRRKDIETGKDIHLTGSDFDTARKFDIQRYVDMKTYKGMRHMLGQPVRGQRTRSHFRGGRIVGVMRKAIKLQMAAAATQEKKEEEK